MLPNLHTKQFSYAILRNLTQSYAILRNLLVLAGVIKVLQHAGLQHVKVKLTWETTISCEVQQDFTLVGSAGIFYMLQACMQGSLFYKT